MKVTNIFIDDFEAPILYVALHRFVVPLTSDEAFGVCNNDKLSIITLGECYKYQSHHTVNDVFNWSNHIPS